MFPDLSFQIISFPCLLRALIAPWDELRLLFDKFPVDVGNRAGEQFLQCSSCVLPGFGVLAASLNLADIC